MRFSVKCEYYPRKSTVPIRTTYFVDLPKWSVTEAKKAIMKILISIAPTKVVILDHKEM